MFQKILVPIDLAHESSWQRVLPVAVEQVGKQGATLHVMTVVDINLDITAVRLPEDFNRQYLEQCEKRLSAVVDQHVPDDVNVQTHVCEGRAYQQILRVAGEVQSDLIIVASTRPSLQDYLLGSNAARVVRHASCSVLVVRD